MKHLIFKASELADSRKLSLDQKKEFDSFIEKKLQTYQPLNSGSFDQLLKGLEELLDQGFEFKTI